MSENKVTLESYLNLIRFFKCFRKETFNFGYLFLIKKKILRSYCLRMIGLVYCQETYASVLLIVF